MKKHYILVALSLLFVLSNSAMAQTEKGKYSVGGSFSFSTSDSGGDFGKDYSLYIAPRFGYFIKNNFEIGAGLDLSWNMDSKGVGGPLSIAPFAKYYFGEENIKPFVSSGYGIDLRGSSTGALNVSPGIALFLNDYVAIEMALTYQNIHNYGRGSSKNSLDLNAGFKIFL